jgi:hypothetical protein
MPGLAFSSDIAISLAVLIFSISQIVMAQWPDLRRWPDTITTRSAGLDNPVVPVGPTFAIWGLIFAWCLAFGVWQVLPAQRGNDLLQAVAPLAALLFLFNTVWEWWVPRRSLDWGSVAIIIIEVALSLSIVTIITLFPRELTTTETWLVKGPLFVFAGWASAAAFVNLSSTLVWAKVLPDPDKGATPVIILACAILFCGVLAFASGSMFYALPVAWALGGIALASRGKPARRAVGLLAALSAPVVILIAA